jgi:hypothetical protein
MQLHLTFRYDGKDWQIRGLPRNSARRFEDLAEALDYAKNECAAEPAYIELFVDGSYMVTVVQQRGWPLQRCRLPEAEVVVPARMCEPRRGSRILHLVARLWQSVPYAPNRLRPHQTVRPAGRGSGARLLLRR